MTFESPITIYMVSAAKAPMGPTPRQTSAMKCLRVALCRLLYNRARDVRVTLGGDRPPRTVSAAAFSVVGQSPACLGLLSSHKTVVKCPSCMH